METLRVYCRSGIYLAMAGATPKDRLRLSVVDRFLILRLNEPKALLPDLDMAEDVAEALTSSAPSYSIICDLRGLTSFTSDVEEFLPPLLSVGAAVLAPPKIDIAEDEVPSVAEERELSLQDDRDHFLRHIRRLVGRDFPVLHVRGGELPVRYTDIPLEPFFDERYLTQDQKNKIAMLIGDNPPSEAECEFLRKSSLPGLLPKPFDIVRDWYLYRVSVGDVLARRRGIQSLIESEGRNSLLVQYALQVQGDSISVVPYHTHSVHQVQVRDEVLLGRPAVLAAKTRFLLKSELFQFENMLARRTVSENELQKFLESHPTIFQALGYSNIYPRLVLEREDGRRLIPDFMLEPVHDEWWDILDIKTPRKPVIVGTADRRRFSSAVCELVAQLREYGAAFEDRKLARAVEEKYGVKCYRPKLIGVIGRDNLHEADKLELRRLMTSYQDIRILTFGQLLRVAKSRLLI